MIGINNVMPINSSNHKLGDLYGSIYNNNNKKKIVSESTNSQEAKQKLINNYYSNTPFHKFQTDYTEMYSGYRVNTTLRESYKNDLNTAIYIMEKNPQLCNEIFGAIGQKIKQGVQAGAQAVQNKLLQPIISMIISKLPKAKQEELAKAVAGGEQALQQFIQKEGDPKVSAEVAAQGAPVSESRDQELMHAYQILSIMTMDTTGVINEDAAQNKFKQFQKTLNQIAGEIKDPAIQQQAQALSSYIQQNYSTRGKAKQAPAAQPGKQAPAQPQAPAAPPVLQTPSAGPLAPAGSQGGIIPPKGVATVNVTPGGPQRAPTVNTSNTGAAAPAAQGGGSLIGKIGSFIKNNPKLSTAAAIGLLGATVAATGGLSVITPFIIPALKSAGVGAVLGGAKGAMGGGGVKGALKGAGVGAGIGALGSVAGQAFDGSSGGTDTGSAVNPNAQSPESLGTAEAPVDTGSEVNPNAQSPESLGGGGYEAPTGQEEVSQAQGSEELAAAEMAGAGQSSDGTGDSDEYTSAQGNAQAPAAPAASGKGAEQMGQQAQQAQAQKAAANLQPGETLKRDSLGRTFRVKAK